jgi:hypothetical protein
MQRGHLARTLPEPSCSYQIVNVKQINALIPKDSPNSVPGSNGVRGLVPVPSHNPLVMCNIELAPQSLKLRIVEIPFPHLAKLGCKVGGCDGRLVGGQILVLGVIEIRERRVEEHITWGGCKNIRELGVSSSDDGDGVLAESGTIVGSEPVAASQRLQGGKNGRPGLVRSSLQVDEEVESLLA